MRELVCVCVCVVTTSVSTRTQSLARTCLTSSTRAIDAWWLVLLLTVLELKAELKKLPGTDHLASKLLVALKDDAEQQLLQKFTLSEYLDVMLSDLPPAFARF